MTRTVLGGAVTGFLMAVICAACTNELAPDPLVRPLLREATAWPDAVAPGELVTLPIEVLDDFGRTIQGVGLVWTSSDPSVLRITAVEPAGEAGGTSARPFAMAMSLRPGDAEVTVRVVRVGFEEVEYRAPVVVSADGWPEFLSVGDSETIQIGLTHLDESLTGPLQLSWTSNDPAVVQVTPVDAEPSRAVVTARSRGTARLTFVAEGARVMREEFAGDLTIGPLTVQPAPAWPTLLPVTGSTGLSVEVLDAMGHPRTETQVRWSSTNVSAFTVDEDGLVTALARGGGELVAAVGTPPFEVAEYRAPFQVVEKWASVSAGSAHTCAITTTDGSGYCWGANDRGQLGRAIGTSGPVPLPSRVVTFRRFSQLEAGGTHTCGREGLTNLLCWGSRTHAQLGDGWCPVDAGIFGIICTEVSPGPVSIVTDGVLGAEEVAVSDIAPGGIFTCFENGLQFRFSGAPDTETVCWGTEASAVSQDPGSITLGLTADAALASGETVGPAAGGFHACIRGRGFRGFPEQAIFCAGLNDQGQLGDGTTTARGEMREPFITDDPGLPPSLPGMMGIAAGLRHTCGWSTSSVWCWGSNAAGQLGAPSADVCSLGACSLRPIEVGIPLTVVDMSAGDRHTCALTDEGAIWCWGANERAQLGQGSAGGSSQSPMLVSGGHTFTSMAAGAAHTCGVTLDGSIYCWGANGTGQLGDGTTVDRAVPTRVAEGS